MPQPTAVPPPIRSVTAPTVGGKDLHRYLFNELWANTVGFLYVILICHA